MTTAAELRSEILRLTREYHAVAFPPKPVLGGISHVPVSGKTFDERTFVVLDEAQNTTPSQMKMFLTRIGEESRVVVNGDIRQSDIRGPNGLADAIERLRGVPSVYVHRFEREDIVRSGLVREIIDRYEPEEV